MGWKIFSFVCAFMVSVCLSNISIASRIVDAYGPYDIVRILQDFTSQIQTSLNMQTEKDFVYSTSYPNKYEINYGKTRPNSSLLSNFDSRKEANSSCLYNIMYTIENLRKTENPWALRLIDSYGKPESGILEANVKWLGDYYECVNVYAPPKANSSLGNFYGKYCTLQYSVEVGNITVPFTNGMCIPDPCSPSELTEEFVKLLHIAKSIPALNGTNPVNVTSFTCKPTSKPLNTPAIAMICLMSFFGFLAAIGSSVTMFEYIFKKPRLKGISHCDNDSFKSYEINNDVETSSQDVLLHEDIAEAKTSDYFEKFKPFLKCFCIFTNGSKLLNTNKVEGELLCLHGIRFLSMTWVILCHTFVFGLMEIRNLKEMLTLIDSVVFEVIVNGFYSVDSFFLLSGFLLSYLFLQEYLEKKTEMSWPYFYVHRYLRLTPVYMVVLGFSSTIYFYLGSGPFWPDGVVDVNCKTRWWRNLLYINNFQKTTEQCMAWSWYLANDMQFFIISPLFLLPLCRWRKIGFLLLGLTLCATCLTNFFITYHYDLFAGIGNVQDVAQNPLQFVEKFTSFFEKIYIKPYTRMGPYLVGICLGYILFQHKNHDKPKMSCFTLFGGWAISSTVALTCVYGLYHRHPSLLVASFYNAFNHTCFAAGLAWVIYVCLTDQGGFVNRILSYKLFIPLSRLTYCAYLIHPIIIMGYYGALKTSLNFSFATMVITYLGFLTVTYAFSLLVSLIFESPVIGLEKLMRKKCTIQRDRI